MAKTMASLQAFPSSILPRARSRALIPFPFPFERLPRRLTADKRSSQNMNRYSTLIGGFMTKKSWTHRLLFLWTVFWITQGYTDQKEFGAEDLKFCNSKESCLLLTVVVVVVFLLYFDLFSGDR